MATAGRKVVVGWAGLAALLALLAVAGASTLALFDGPGCTGDVTVLSCGSCRDISKRSNGGYNFFYTSGYAAFYNSADCSDSSPALFLSGHARSCNNFAYKSVHIFCSSSLSDWDITTAQQ